MSKYSANITEEELKLHIAEDWFTFYDCKRRIGKIDFCVDIKGTELGLYESTPAMWAEAKAGSNKDILESFIQLILTIGRAKTFTFERPPFFLGAFDAKGKEKMNSTSSDETYNTLLNNLKQAMKALAKAIEPKVYEYGFLKI